MNLDEFDVAAHEAMSAEELHWMRKKLSKRSKEIKTLLRPKNAELDKAHCEKVWVSWLEFMKASDPKLHSIVSRECKSFSKWHWNEAFDFVNSEGTNGNVTCTLLQIELATAPEIIELTLENSEDPLCIKLKWAAERKTRIDFEYPAEMATSLDVYELMVRGQSALPPTSASRRLARANPLDLLRWIFLLYLADQDLAEFCKIEFDDLVWKKEDEKTEFLQRLDELKPFCDCCAELYENGIGFTSYICDFIRDLFSIDQVDTMRLVYAVARANRKPQPSNGLGYNIPSKRGSWKPVAWMFNLNSLAMEGSWNEGVIPRDIASTNDEMARILLERPINAPRKRMLSALTSQPPAKKPCVAEIAAALPAPPSSAAGGANAEKSAE